uniref:Uncharacterized protein MANES_10G097500 n=1 Tax=Rhizophora mucronata TaxID=61149 RepID=A0A2P2KR28_RHIMU
MEKTNRAELSYFRKSDSDKIIMGSTFLSSPAKRPIQYTVSGMNDSNPYSSAANSIAAVYESSNKRSKPLPPPLPVPPGHVSFRLLCHASRIGGVIGKSGNVIKQLQQQSGSKIRIEEPLAESDDRVITIVGQTAVLSEISWPRSGDADNGDCGEEEFQVSKGQEALIRVFERILEVAAETGGAKVTPRGLVSCRLLAEASHVGSVIGKGGKVVEKIRKDCGVKVRVLTDKLPLCADPTEEMVEIEGDVFAVKKALVMVSRCLQDCQPTDKTRITGSKPVEAVPQDSLPDVHFDLLSQSNRVLPSLPSSSINYLSRVPPLSLESDRATIPDSTVIQQEVVFKILCSNDRVGGVIGKGGSIIKALQNETGAVISIGAMMAECDERLITVTASENPQSRYSAAQKATVLVFSRSVEAGIERGMDSISSKVSPVTARLVVPSNQVGCLLGQGGVIISAMRRLTGAGIRIIGVDQVPKYVQQNDQLVQVSGDVMQVKDAIYHITGRLRVNLFISTLGNGTRSTSSVLTETSPYGRLRDSLRDTLRDPLTNPLRDMLTNPLRDPLTNPLRDTVRDPMTNPLRDTLTDPLRDTGRDPLRESLRNHASLTLPSSVSIASKGLHTTLANGMDHLGLSHNFDSPPSPRLWASKMIAGANPRSTTDVSRGLAAFKGGLELGSGSKSAIVTNATIEILVPENVIGCVYGENGSNLTRLRQISGAKVIVHEPRLGTSDRIVVISGTPDETQAAQSLLQAFILTGQS